MKLQLSGNNTDKHAIIDDEDYEIVSKYKWHLSDGYARATVYESGIQKTVRLHRLILKETNPKVQIDHKNRNRLDNRKSNLRKCSTSENQKNKKSSGKSKYLGVSFRITKQKYKNKKGVIKTYTYSRIISQIKVNDKYIYLGTFKDEVGAAKAYNEAAIKYHGEFANPNNINI